MTHANKISLGIFIGLLLVVAIVVHLQGERMVADLRVMEPEATVVAPIPVQTILNDVNKARADQGAPPVVLNDKLSAAAQARLEDMDREDYFDHEVENSGFLTMRQAIKGTGYKYCAIGENLALNITTPLVVDAWVASPGHRDNMLNAQFEDMGIAYGNVSINTNNDFLVVQLLGKQGCTL